MRTIYLKLIVIIYFIYYLLFIYLLLLFIIFPFICQKIYLFNKKLIEFFFSSLSVIGFTANAFDYLKIEIAIPVITIILWSWWIIVLVKFTSVSQKDMNEVYNSLFRDVPDLHATPIRKFFQRLKR